MESTNLIPCLKQTLHASLQGKIYDFPAWLPDIQRISTISVFRRLPHQTTNTQLGFNILMWWELKGFDISISINGAGNIQHRAVWRQKNRITDKSVWNYKEIMHTRDIKQAFSDPSQRTWYNELIKSSRKCCTVCMSAFENTFIMEVKLCDGRLMLTEGFRIWMHHKICFVIMSCWLVN